MDLRTLAVSSVSERETVQREGRERGEKGGVGGATDRGRDKVRGR